VVIKDTMCNVNNRERIIDIINNDSNFIDDTEIYLNFLYSRIEEVKFIFEYCEKINKKINLDDIVYSFLSDVVWTYIKYLRKHNYSLKRNIVLNMNTSFLLTEYIIVKNINKHIHDVHETYLYNNIIIPIYSNIYIENTDYLILFI